MKFTVNKSDITEAVSNIQRAVSTKTSIPALEGILIGASEEGLELCAYDLELGITTVIPAFVVEPGKAVLSAKLFSDIVRRTPAETVTVTVDEKNMATLESGYSRFSIIGIPAAEFPELPKLTDSTQISLPGNLLKSMIRQTLFAIAESDAKPIHQGSLFNIEKGMLDVVSVDGYRLAVRREAIDFPEDLSFVVPGKTLSELLKLIKDSEEPVEISAGRRHILFKIDNYTVISSLLEGEFLNYKAAIPPGEPDGSGPENPGGHRQRGARLFADYRQAEKPHPLPVRQQRGKAELHHLHGPRQRPAGCRDDRPKRGDWL